VGRHRNVLVLFGIAVIVIGLAVTGVSAASTSKNAPATTHVKLSAYETSGTVTQESGGTLTLNLPRGRYLVELFGNNSLAEAPSVTGGSISSYSGIESFTDNGTPTGEIVELPVHITALSGEFSQVLQCLCTGGSTSDVEIVTATPVSVQSS